MVDKEEKEEKKWIRNQELEEDFLGPCPPQLSHRQVWELRV